MFAKLVALTAVLVCLAATLLVLRQQRLELAHEAASLHYRLTTVRHDLWDAQARSSILLSPASLQRKLDGTRLALEPIAPDRPGAPLARGPESSQTR